MTTAAEHMAATLLRLAGVERDAGNTLRAEIFEAAADLSGATCSACGAPLIGGVQEDIGAMSIAAHRAKLRAEHEPSGPPIDGREVDRAPGRLPHVWERDDGEGIVLQRCRCPIGKSHADTETGDGEAGNPPAASADEEVQGTSGGESAPSPPHRWLGPDRIEDCFCLIGDDHVAEPRFEKES